MEEIKAIETFFNGCYFRSRLEARWAVLFDALNIEYEYEPEGYELSDGSLYLPDFYLPQFKYYAEVKGASNHICADLTRAQQFVMDKKTAMIILSAIPYDPLAQGLYWFPIMYWTAKSHGSIHRRFGFFQTDSDCDEVWFQDDYAVGSQAYWTFRAFTKENVDWNEMAYKQIQARSGAEMDDENFGIKEAFDLRPIQSAILKARTARFEHGETPIARRQSNV